MLFETETLKHLGFIFSKFEDTEQLLDISEIFLE